MRGSLAALALGIFCRTLAAPLNQTGKSQLPIVDLGYETHQALSYDSANDFYKFSNIRYARPPVGELRFRAPQPPVTNRSQVQDGAVDRTCPQGVPLWQSAAFGPVHKYSAAGTFNLTSWESDIASAKPPNIDWTRDNSEDCLFLDVSVSRKAFSGSTERSGSAGNKGAPVLVWIHGGGYVLGSKTGFPAYTYDPNTLLGQVNTESDAGMVFVALNYRLGALGFLAGPDVAKDGNQNAGLLDQRMALQWVQKNIHLFGGDPDQVTVMGESAGAGSILLHMTAYGGKRGRAPFQQAIAQSPGTLGTYKQPQSTYDGFLSALNVTSLSAARKLPSKTVIDANAQYIGAAPYTTYLFYPTLDGSYVPAPPADLIKSGRFDRSIKVLSAVNSLEGGFFFDPSIKTEDQFRRNVAITLAGANSSTLDYVVNQLYPPVFDGSLGYTDRDTRQMAANGENIFYCNEELITASFGKNSYSYQFSALPGVHTQDTSYTFTDHSLSAPVPFPLAKQALQLAVTSFTLTGVPKMVSGNGSTASATPFPTWDPATRRVVNITGNGAELGTRVANQTRCDWWLNAASVIQG